MSYNKRNYNKKDWPNLEKIRGKFDVTLRKILFIAFICGKEVSHLLRFRRKMALETT